MDQSKKTMRHFYCRDVLWETFEQMANDFDCSIDYLINEAMRYYARSKNYQSSAQGNTQNPGPPLANSSPSHGSYAHTHAAARRTAPPPPPGGPAAPPVAATPRRPAPGVSRSAASSYRETAAPPGAPTLYLVYSNQRYPITKDQFIIGRGSKTSDLAIKDGNISRKHAAIIRRNGTYYIKDLGSTNGIDYKGMRIDNKRIDEGDVFHLCDYELRFTYRD
jgi:hypothetical protein